MQLDSFTIGALGAELDKKLSQARVDKIHMPRPDCVVLSLFSADGPCRLLLSAGALPRMHLTEGKLENPDEPPMLCMLLRKHLSGGKVLSVRQPKSERMLIMDILAPDELGVASEKQLICEMIARRQNIVLTGGGMILGCLRKMSPEAWPGRPMLPGMSYRMPPQDRRDLADMSKDELREYVKALPEGDLARELLGGVCGLSPQLAGEAVAQTGGEREALAGWIWELVEMKRAGALVPYTIWDGERPAGVSCVPVTFRPGIRCQREEGFSRAVDLCCLASERTESKKYRVEGLQKKLEASKKRISRRVENQREELESARGRKQVKDLADLIMSNLHAIPEGSSRAVVVNYFDPAMPQAEIALDPQLSPRENAGRLFDKYAKMKRTEEALSERVSLGEQELLYLDTVLYQLSQVENARELAAISLELEESGYLKAQPGAKRRKTPASAPEHTVSPGGFAVWRGRNNRENDEMRKAFQGGDLWFHVKDKPGAHVILCREGKTPAKEDIEYAASAAAYYSSAREDGRAAVDYTLLKHVKKPRGARPGMVHYTDCETVFIAPKDPHRDENK